jgi:5-methylcytosine-specific restriction endonuclease McrA
VFEWQSTESIEIDHKQAVCNGGGEEELNIWCLCTKCHREKTNKDLAILSMNHYQGLPFSDVEKDEIKRRLAGWLL